MWRRGSTRYRCNLLSKLYNLNLANNCIYRQSCRLPDSPIRGVVFRIQISPRVRSQNLNGSKSSVRDLGQSDLCKNLGKFGSLPCPFKRLKLALKNLVRFSSPTASGAILRGKYKHFCLKYFVKTSRSHNSVYNYKKKSEKS